MRIKAVVYGALPASFMQETMLPNLAKEPFCIDAIHRELKEMTKSNAEFDLVLLVREMANTSSQRALAGISGQGIPTAMVGRKSANWDKEIGPITRLIRRKKEEAQKAVDVAKEEKLAQVKSIPDSLLTPAIEAYKSAVESGATEDEIVRAMTPFFVGRPLTNWLQLKGYIQRTVETGRAPAAFLSWVNKRGNIGPVHALPPPAAETPEPPVVSTVEEPVLPAPPPSTPSLTISELTELYDISLKEGDKRYAELQQTLEQERATYREDVHNLKAKLREEDVLLRRISELEAEVSRFRALPPTPRIAVNLGKALNAFKTLIDQGLMTELEAFRQLMKLAEGE